MQKLLAAGSEWHAPWLERVLPRVERLAGARPQPPGRAAEASGLLRRYYEQSMTLEKLQPGKIDLLDALAGLTVPAEVIDKTVYCPWFDGALEPRLRE